MAYTDDVTALGQYLAAAPYARENLSAEQFAIFEEDLAKARAAVEVAWLERGAGALTAGPREPSLPSRVEPMEAVGRTTSHGCW